MNAHFTLERVGEAAARAAAAALLEGASSSASLIAPTQRELKRVKEELEAERAAAREAVLKAETAGQQAAKAAEAVKKAEDRAALAEMSAAVSAGTAKQRGEELKILRDTQAANAYITTGDLSALRVSATRRTGEQDWQLFVGTMLEREKRLGEVAATAETAAKAADAAAAARGAALERTSRDLLRLERLAASQDAQKKVLERGCSGLRKQIKLLSDAARAAGVDVDALLRAASNKGKSTADVAAASAADDSKKRLKSRFGSLSAAKLSVGAVEESWGTKRPSDPATGKQREKDHGDFEMAEIEDEAEEFEGEVYAASSSAAPSAATALANDIPLLGGGTVNPFRRVVSESAVAGAGNLRSFAALSPPLLPPPPAVSVWHDSDDDDGVAKEEEHASNAKRARSSDAAQPAARPPLIQKQHSLPNTLAPRSVNAGVMSSMAASGLAPRAAPNGLPFGGLPLGAAPRGTSGGKAAPTVLASQRQTTLAWRTSSTALVAPTVVDLSEL